ncbi:MAG TPA: addiction module protein [Sulfurovum sp.]|nr:addiction module protein [Sulfurovum sp.]
MLAIKQQALFDEIETLPIDIKTKIVDKILTSINPTNKSIDDLWITEVLKRKKEIESGEVTLIDGDEVFKKLSLRFDA